MKDNIYKCEFLSTIPSAGIVEVQTLCNEFELFCGTEYARQINNIGSKTKAHTIRLHS